MRNDQPVTFEDFTHSIWVFNPVNSTHLILGDPVPVAHDELQLEIGKTAVPTRELEYKGFVKNRV